MLAYNSAAITPPVVTTGATILISIGVEYRDFTFNELDIKDVTFTQLDDLSLSWPEFEGGDWHG